MIQKKIPVLEQDAENEAIEFIKRYEPEEGYFVGISFGKDSTVLYDLVKRSGVKAKFYYSFTGIDPPELTRFGKKYFPDVIWMKPKMSFYKYMQIKGFPTKFTRWCCDVLKKYPTILSRVPLRHRLMGIRAEESFNRSKRSRIEKNKRLGTWIYKPIFRWMEWEIWEYLDRYNLPYCSLYDEGFSRLGCVVCPFLANKNQASINKYKDRWPLHYKMFEKTMRKLWDNGEKERQIENGYSTTFEEFLNDWYLGMPRRK